MSVIKSIAAILLVSVASPAFAAEPDDSAALRAEIERLKAAVAALEARLDQADAKSASNAASIPKPVTPAPAGGSASGAGLASVAPVKQENEETSIVWRGSPQFIQDDARFKVKGRLQYDAGYLVTPSAIRDKARGFSNETRRLRLGGEGMLNSSFGYKLEFELADNAVELVDAFITYRKDRWLVTLGNHNSFQSLDELIGDTSGSVMERAAFTDAFNFERRLGLSVQYQQGPMLLQAGVFTDDVRALANSSDGVNGGDENNSVSLDGRMVFAPKLTSGGQLHFATSYHWRDFNRLGEGTQTYAQRPFLHSVNSRFLGVTTRGTGEMNYGVEAAGVFGRFHYAAEGHWLRVLRPGLADPTFFGAYGEVGYYLTKGDSRAYSNGIMGIPKPAHPWGEGGIGSIQINVRYDYLDLNDAGLIGGTQNGGIVGVIWSPIQYLRFNFNYGHLSYTDAIIAAGTDRDYSVDVFGVRAELDF